MIREKTSTFYFQKSCMDVWRAATSGTGAQGFTYAPMTVEEYASALHEPLKDGKILARVTDMAPGERCAYVLHAEKFNVHWSASFSPVGGSECRMVMTEVYEFHPNARGQYLLSLLFLRQGRQHKAFQLEIEARLRSAPVEQPLRNPES